MKRVIQQGLPALPASRPDVPQLSMFAVMYGVNEQHLPMSERLLLRVLSAVAKLHNVICPSRLIPDVRPMMLMGSLTMYWHPVPSFRKAEFPILAAETGLWETNRVLIETERLYISQRHHSKVVGVQFGIYTAAGDWPWFIDEMQEVENGQALEKVKQQLQFLQWVKGVVEGLAEFTIASAFFNKCHHRCAGYLTERQAALEKSHG